VDCRAPQGTDGPRAWAAQGRQGLLQARPLSEEGREFTSAYLAMATVRRRPRTLGLNFSVWTLDRLIGYLKEQTQIEVADETLRTHLRQHGISFSRPQHKVSSPDEDYVQKKRRLKTHETT
jgi:transposase